MKKQLIIFLFSLACISTATAQDYKADKTGGQLIINLPSVIVEGYSGNQVVFSSEAKETDTDSRAQGLRVINGSGYMDNTGLGISVINKGTSMEVNPVSPNLSIKILVPKGITITYDFHKVLNAGKAYFKNLDNEIGISTDYNEVDLENVSGPLSVRTLYGAVDATFSNPVKGPVSIVSVYEAVDVTIPPTTSANIRLSSSHGTILASPDLKIEVEKQEGDNMINYGNVVNGKLNGGGAIFKLTSDFGKIYLRSK